jgi:hypothetical protein
MNQYLAVIQVHDVLLYRILQYLSLVRKRRKRGYDVRDLSFSQIFLRLGFRYVSVLLDYMCGRILHHEV